MKMKKLISMMLAVTVCLSLFAACSPSTGKSSSSNGNDVSSTSQSNAVDTKKEPINLTYCYFGGNPEIATMESLVKEFEAANPEYKIDQTYTDGGSYITKLQTFFASGTAPDVMTLANDGIYDYVGQNLFEDLTPYMEKDNLLNGTWAPDVLGVFQYDGKIIAAPQMSKPFAIAYNKKIFDAAGVAYPKKGWTEDEFVATAKKLTSGEGPTKIYGMHFMWVTQEIMRSLYKDKEFYNIDEKKLCIEGNDAFKHAVELFSSLITVDGVSPNSSEESAIGGGFETGRFAMTFSAPWDMPGYRDVIGNTFDWDVVELPTSTKYGSWQTSLRADGMAISINSKNKDAAWEFIKFHTTNKDSQKKLSAHGIPSLLAYTSSEEYLTDYIEGAVVKHDKSVYVEATKRGSSLQNAGVWAELNTVLFEEFQRILLEGISVDQALANTQSRCAKILK